MKIAKPAQKSTQSSQNRRGTFCKAHKHTASAHITSFMVLALRDANPFTAHCKLKLWKTQNQPTTDSVSLTENERAGRDPHWFSSYTVCVQVYTIKQFAGELLDSYRRICGLHDILCLSVCVYVQCTIVWREERASATIVFVVFNWRASGNTNDSG